jgi:hypothetical protein
MREIEQSGHLLYLGFPATAEVQFIVLTGRLAAFGWCA